MKQFKLLLIISLIIAMATSAYAQDKKYDSIIKHNGKKESVYVTTVNDRDIIFTYPNETTTNTISKNLVKEIQFSSGRVQQISEKIIINGEDDWEKVQITTLESDVVGLKRLGEIKAKASGATAFSSQKHVDQRATEKMKKEAARMKAHIIFIQSQNTKSLTYGSTAKTLKQGVGYGYDDYVNTQTSESKSTTNEAPQIFSVGQKIYWIEYSKIKYGIIQDINSKTEKAAIKYINENGQEKIKSKSPGDLFKADSADYQTYVDKIKNEVKKHTFNSGDKVKWSKYGNILHGQVISMNEIEMEATVKYNNDKGLERTQTVDAFDVTKEE